MTPVPTGLAYTESDYDIATPPLARDELDKAAFDSLMQRGLDEAKKGLSRPSADVFAELRKEISSHGYLCR